MTGDCEIRVSVINPRGYLFKSMIKDPDLKKAKQNKQTKNKFKTSSNGTLQNLKYLCQQHLL